MLGEFCLCYVAFARLYIRFRKIYIYLNRNGGAYNIVIGGRCVASSYAHLMFVCIVTFRRQDSVDECLSVDKYN